MKQFKYLIFSLLFLACSHTFAQEHQTNKKLYHNLLFSWSDSTDTATVSKVFKLFKELPGKIDGFDEVIIVDIVESSEKYENLVIMVFKNEKALNKYQDHPDHLKIKKLAIPELTRFSEFDYWK